MAGASGGAAPVYYMHVRLTDGLLFQRQRVNAAVTLPMQYKQCRDTGRIEAWKLVVNPALPDIPKPHIFWDSDVAKWLEAAAYALALKNSGTLARRADDLIELIAAAQQPDGYLNLHFTINEPTKRFTNLRDEHELYCAGHLMEAAVAYAEATGKTRLLDVVKKYADLIGDVFGPGKGQKRGYCGHPEIELGLVRLFRWTGEKRYLALAKFFVDERGQSPHYFDQEAAARDTAKEKPDYAGGEYEYFQAHVPIREQKTAEGHAVRLGYLYAGAADVALEFNDRELLRACRTILDNITSRRMYVHGGIGSQHHGERFSFDFDLPNEDAYAETCAQISLIFFCQRMLAAEVDGRYGDIVEKCLYNSVISGVSLDGGKFYYENVLASCPPYHRFARRRSPDRQPWFGCACCPPNLARLLASIGGYLYGRAPSTIFVHQYASSTVTIPRNDGAATLRQTTDYPWDKTVRIRVELERPAKFAIALRIPGWCRKARLKVNGKTIVLGAILKKGYAYIRRLWNTGDRIKLTLPMPVERLYPHPNVRQDVGRVAVMRGPILFCLEEVDNGKELNAITLTQTSRFTERYEPKLLGGVVTLQAKAQRRASTDWNGSLYRTESARRKPFTAKFVPYYAWANRRTGEMLVWVSERES